MCNGGRQGSKAHHPGHMCKLRPGPSECLIRKPALRYVLDSAYVLKSALSVSGSVGDGVQILVRTVGHPQSELVVMVAANTSRQRHLFSQQGAVFRVDPATDLLEHHGRIFFKLEDAIGLL